MSTKEILADRVMSCAANGPSPCFVAICGWADTGKTTLARELCSTLRSNNIGADSISTDAFLKDRAERNELGISGYNPRSIDAVGLAKTIAQLVARREYVYHPYDNGLGRRLAESRVLMPQAIVVVEGIHAFHECISNQCGLRIFIDAPEQTLRDMRVRANLLKRHMSSFEATRRVDHELLEYRTHVLPRKALAHMSIRVSPEFEYSIPADGA